MLGQTKTIIVETLLASAFGILGTIIAAYIWETKIRDRVSVRRITSSDDADLIGVLELYQELFPDNGTNYSCDDLIELTKKHHENAPGRHVKADDIILVARFKGEVAGFLFCHFYPARQKAIVSYYGIQKQVVEARRSAASTLLQKLYSMLRTKKCAFILFDSLRPGLDLPHRENSERKARLSLLKQSAKVLHLRAYKLQFDYKSPRITLAEGTHEDSLSLPVVPLDGTQVSSFTKKQALEFLRFVYQDCYGDIYRTDDSRFHEYHAYLSKRVENYESLLPDLVKAV